jgi:hypothetical protein
MTSADRRQPVPVEAGWALWGKHPGSNDDYSVLSCSDGPFSRADYTAILTRFSPGTPSARRQGAGKLPWVTFSWVGAEDNVHLGIAVHDVTEQVDGAGRPIAETSYFCLPYAVIAKFPISYYGLYEAVQRPDLRPGDRGLARLEVPRLDPHEISLSIADFGEPAVAGVAALLLSSPVSMTQSEGSELADRLRFLDAVASLLPYGYRARFTASTWADSGSRHRIRLTFADRPRDDATAVPWRASPDLSASPASREYVVQLDRFLRPAAAGSRAFDMTEIVAHLAGEAEPRKFDTSQAAIQSLRTIDLPAAVAAAVRDRNAIPAEVRQVAGGGRLSELPPHSRRAVWQELLSYGEPEDLPAVAAWWDRVVGEDPPAMLPELVRTCRDLLWRPTPAAPLWEYLRLADGQGIGDELLAGLAAAPGDSRMLAGGLATAASLVYQRMLAAGPEGHAHTVAALPSNPALMAQVTVELARTGAGAAPWLDRLSRQAPRLLAPFRTVLSADGGALTAEALADLAGWGLECVWVLLEVPADAAAHARLLPGVARWLARRDDVPAAEQRRWKDQLQRPSILGGRNRAYADLALLAAGLAPHWLAIAATQPYWNEYVSSLCGEWRLVEQVQPDHPGRLVLSLAAYLDSETWTADPRLVMAVQDLAGRQANADARYPVVDIVALTLSYAPAGQVDPGREWLRQVVARRPDAYRDGARQSLVLLGAESSARDIAMRCWRAYENGVSAASAGRTLSESAALGSRAAGQLGPAGPGEVLTAVEALLRETDKQSRPGLFQRIVAPGGLPGPGRAVRKIRSRRDTRHGGPAPMPAGPEAESLSDWAAACGQAVWAELNRTPPAIVRSGTPR